METTVKLKLGFAALMIVSGIGVAMYPVVSNALAQRHGALPRATQRHPAQEKMRVMIIKVDRRASSA